MDRLHVATLNILNLADRWYERLPLLLADFAALQPDLIGMQEVVYVMQQDRVIGAAGDGQYAVVRGWAGRPEYGNSLMSKLPLVPTELDRLDLGIERSDPSGAVSSSPDGGSAVLFAVTHLHHLPADQAERRRAAEPLLDWLDESPEADATIVVGDFNADPTEPTYARMRAAGFRSAYREVNGAEPARDLAVGPPGAGDGHRRRPGLPRLHLDPRRGRGSSRRGSRSTGRPSTTRRSTPRPLRASAPISRSGDGGAVRARTLRLAHRGDWRHAPENTLAAMPAALRSRLRRARVRRPALAPTASRWSSTTRRSTRVQGRPGASTRCGRRPSRRSASRRSRTSWPRSTRASVPRRRAQGRRHDRAVVEVLRGRAGRTCAMPSCPRSSRRPSTRSRGLAPALAALAQRAGARRRRRRAGASSSAAPGSACDSQAIDARRSSTARAAGLEVAAWTVRRRPTFDRLAALGVAAVCVEAAALDG